MILTIKKQIEREVEIEFPAYFNYAGAIKILSPTSYIQAIASGGEWLLQKYKNMPGCVGHFITEGTPITAEQFNEIYRKAMNHVVHEAFMQEHENESREEIKEALYEDNMQLCNSLNELE